MLLSPPSSFGMRCALLAVVLLGCTGKDVTAVLGPACDGSCSAENEQPAGTVAHDAGRVAALDAGTPAPVDGGLVVRRADTAVPHDAAPLPLYTLVVDAPSDRSAVDGVVTVSGRSAGFVNVEVWDATHHVPPLARATPRADGTFTMTVDSGALPAGQTTWTVWGWDSPAGAPPTQSASVDLTLTVGKSSSAPDAGLPVGPQTVGSGDIALPAQGPLPSETTKVGGAPFVLVKNWDFGTSGTVRDTAGLVGEFQFHDQFGTIANGSNYGAVTVASSAATAVSASGLGLPGSMQPVEDPARPTREFSDGSMLAHVRPLSATQTSCTVSAHDTGNGSLTARWKLASGGALLGKDILWETRVRMPKPLAAYWFALWTAGTQWNKGAEMDVVESFGTPNISLAGAFHVNSVGGKDTINYDSWPNGLNTAGVPASDRDLRAWHVWTWLYTKDDNFKVFYDGTLVQSGSIHWTLGGASAAQPIDMFFLFDFGWGHTQIADVNISLPAASFPITYEIDYSRVYLR